MTTVPERLEALRAEMKKEGIDAWMVPTDDFHGSEYVGDYFKCRKYLTGFTGSAGTALVTQKGAYLWTDGRYFLQAEDQLEGTGISLMKTGEEGVPAIDDFLEKNLAKGQTLGFDGRCVTGAAADSLLKKLGKKGVSWKVSTASGPLDLVGRIWKTRPELSSEQIWELDEVWTGESRRSKLKRLSDAMAAEECAYHIITALDDIAWLLNLRGNDIECNPVFLSYLVMTKDRVILFAGEGTVPDDAAARLHEDGVELMPYGDVYGYVSSIPDGARVLLDPASVNFTIISSLKSADIVRKSNPTTLMKAVKNKTEMGHMRDAHIKDGVAVCRFIFWLKEQMKHHDPNHPVTELSASRRLHEFRQEDSHFLGESFETIAAYGPHGAIVHYSPTEESDIEIRPSGFLLLDSGGQYLEGTTDITRTIACGPLSREEKEFYTRVLRGNLNLGSVKFLHGCTGMAFDYLARQPFWEIGMNYNHGTGHGVGYLLNVHEGPNSISYKLMQGRPLPCVLEEGMITSNEPGFYMEGKFGARCENLMLCVNDEKNSFGQFMRFDTLTMVPWEADAIVSDMLSERERKLLDEYHAMVYEKISPYLEGVQKEWLEEATRPMTKT